MPNTFNESNGRVSRAPYIGHFTIEDGLLSLWDEPQPDNPTYFTMVFTPEQRALIEEAYGKAEG